MPGIAYANTIFHAKVVLLPCPEWDESGGRLMEASGLTTLPWWIDIQLVAWTGGLN